jgi:Rps23 Pro-64 3,4-dihydroxylase Tpa1-like proline 4-hydroxylase
MNVGRNDRTDAATRFLMPPHVVVHDFLDAATVAGLLDHALSRECDFRPTGVGSKAVDTRIRISTSLRDLGAYGPILKSKILGFLPNLIARLQVTPFEPSWLETELVAHGDGAFYKRHIDTQTVAQYEDFDEIRVLSGVYYFFVEPKVFSGGALRLYAIGGNSEQNFIDIAPQRNSLLVFPSWAPHEVMPVHRPSGRFIDSRFAINCWLHRKKPGANILRREVL